MFKTLSAASPPPPLRSGLTARERHNSHGWIRSGRCCLQRSQRCRHAGCPRLNCRQMSDAEWFRLQSPLCNSDGCTNQDGREKNCQEKYDDTSPCCAIAMPTEYHSAPFRGLSSHVRRAAVYFWIPFAHRRFGTSHRSLMRTGFSVLHLPDAR